MSLLHKKWSVYVSVTNFGENPVKGTLVGHFLTKRGAEGYASDLNYTARTLDRIKRTHDIRYYVTPRED